MPDATAQGPRTMQCLEVWGGNRAVDHAVNMPGLDAWVFSRPVEGDAEGGDIHYLSSCVTGRVIRLLVADVSGHGAAVADAADRLRQLLRRYVNYVDQRRFVADLNREFVGLARIGQFATASVATVWTPTSDLAITSAGHPPAALYRAARGAWEFIAPPPDTAVAASDIPLGIEDATFGQVRVHLGRRDLALFYTDAVTEMPTADGRLLGQAGLLDLLARLDASRPEALIPALLGALADRAGGRDAVDDMTLLLVRPNEHRPRASVLSGVGTVARLARDVGSALVRRDRPLSLPEINTTNVLGAFFDRANHTGGDRDEPSE